MLLVIWLILGNSARSRELDLMILMGLFQLEMFYGSIFILNVLWESPVPLTVCYAAFPAGVTVIEDP